MLESVVGGCRTVVGSEMVGVWQRRGVELHMELCKM